MLQQGFDTGEDAVGLVAQYRINFRCGEREPGVKVRVFYVFVGPVIGYEGREIIAVAGKMLIDARGEIMPVFLFFLAGVKSSIAGSVRSWPETEREKKSHMHRHPIGRAFASSADRSTIVNRMIEIINAPWHLRQDIEDILVDMKNESICEIMEEMALSMEMPEEVRMADGRLKALVMVKQRIEES
ncbi:MAG TPA: hypothetical protein PLM53_13650 [Spirochaetota bacterium]|nr:hypothetical protein [Spirochaetota bacterium]HPC43045.1 hypothetical protein [Spirochaetota bacterium]HPL17717.1 hypothetical protein [Spirochaetota bacterium]HQF09455.1 hypothetical protein [Spirochaetota bacterium]HQH98138.1 hypothetical protein [Spirochaetota bacterium]